MPSDNEYSTHPRTATDVSHHGGSGMGVKAIIGFVVIFGILYFTGLLPRLKLKPQLESDAAAARTAPPIVTYVLPHTQPTATKVDLPGNIQGSEETSISARASGYLRQWNVDIGDHVKAGQVLALIETPDTDQQVAQAQAQVAGSQASAQQALAQVAGSQATAQQAQANTIMMTANADQAQANIAKAQAAYDQSKSDLAHAQAAVSQAQQQADQQRAQVTSAKESLSLAKTTAERYDELAKEGAINQQTADQEDSAYKTSQANLEAMQSALNASEANIRAAQASVVSSESNVRSYAGGITAAKAAFAAAEANIKASRANESAAQASIRASRANAGAAQANVTSNVANLQRNDILRGFQKVTAPFDGIITSRNAEVGALVSATGGVSMSSTMGSSMATSNTGALFTMVRSGNIRVFVSVPEQYSDSVRTGQPVQVVVGDASSKPIPGIINRSASVLDPTSRTLLAQIDVPNPGGKLRPGMFATVTLSVPQRSSGWRIPDTALLSGAEGNQVAIVTPDNKVHFQDVTIGRDYGKEMDVTQGLTGNEELISNPSNALTEGLTVKAIKAKPPVAPGGAGGPGATGAPGGPGAPPAGGASGAPGAGGRP